MKIDPWITRAMGLGWSCDRLPLESLETFQLRVDIARANAELAATEHFQLPEAPHRPLGDESMPTQARLEARLAAAVRLIENLPAWSIFSISFCAEQNRFLKELKAGRNALAQDRKGDTGI